MRRACVAIYKNKVFQRFARKNDMADGELIEVNDEDNKGE